VSSPPETRSGEAPNGHVWVDGRLLPADGLHLSAFDRGFQLGDGIFETLRARAGNPTELAEHLARLRQSAAGLDIPLPSDIDDQVAAGIRELLAADGEYARMWALQQQEAAAEAALERAKAA